eukprot:symbB.v1.2.029295.t1/scaffold3126.1/size62979/3
MRRILREVSRLKGKFSVENLEMIRSICLPLLKKGELLMNQEDRITAHRSPSDEAKMGGGGESNAAQGQPAGVPAGVPTFHLAEPALPKGVETFSICQKTDRRVEETT